MEPKKDWRLTKLRDTLSLSEYGKYKFYAKDLENIKLIINDVKFKKEFNREFKILKTCYRGVYTLLIFKKGMDNKKHVYLGEIKVKEG